MCERVFPAGEASAARFVLVCIRIQVSMVVFSSSSEFGYVVFKVFFPSRSPSARVSKMPDSMDRSSVSMTRNDFTSLTPQELSPDPGRVHATDGGELDSAGVFQANL